MVTRYGQADVPREVSGRGGPAVRPAAADFPRDVCLTVSRNHAVFLLYCVKWICYITIFKVYPLKHTYAYYTFFWRFMTYFVKKTTIIFHMSYLQNICVPLSSSSLKLNGGLAEALQWPHYGRDSISNHQPHDCLLNRLFRRRSKKTSKLRVTGLCAGKSPGTGEFPALMASNAENVSIWWRHHGVTECMAWVKNYIQWLCMYVTVHPYQC